MKYRIAIWAAAGFLVASGWAAYFFVAGKDHPIETIVSTLVRLTCPLRLSGPITLLVSIGRLLQMSPRMLWSV